MRSDSIAALRGVKSGPRHLAGGERARDTAFCVSCSQADAVADGARELASLSVAEVTRLLHNARFSALAARFTQDEIDGEALLDGVDRECVCVFIPLVYPEGPHSPSLGLCFKTYGSFSVL